MEESARRAALAVAAHLAGVGVIPPKSLISLLHEAAESREWVWLAGAARYAIAHCGLALQAEPYATDARTFLEVCTHFMSAA